MELMKERIVAEWEEDQRIVPLPSLSTRTLIIDREKEGRGGRESL